MTDKIEIDRENAKEIVDLLMEATIGSSHQFARHMIAAERLLALLAQPAGPSISPEKLRELADAEDQHESISVGGLASDVGFPVQPAGPSIEDLAILIRRLMHQLKRHDENASVLTHADGYLRRFGLHGSPLRAAFDAEQPITTKESRMKIYVASSWRNDYQQDVVRALREVDHEVYDFKNPRPGDYGFHWSKIDPEWKSWDVEGYVEGLKHDLAEFGFLSDFNAMKWADACVLVNPCGRSAHLEAGWFVGAGKPLLILMSEAIEPELMYKMADGIYGDLGELLLHLGRLDAGQRNVD